MTGFGSPGRGATARAGVLACEDGVTGGAIIGLASNLSTYDYRPDGVGWHHQYPADVYPMVVYQSATIRLEAAVIEGLDLAIQAPVAQVLLGQDGETVPRLYHYDFGTGGRPANPFCSLGTSASLGDGCCV